jgi:two-component system, OmpR family, sensor kinase
VTSLRSRLTLSYAAVVAVVLIAVALVLTRFAFAFLAEPAFDAVAQAVTTGNAIVAAHPNDSPATIAKLVRAAAPRGVVVMAPPENTPAPPPNDNARGMRQISLESLLGLRPRRVALPQGVPILIAPDLHALAPTVRIYLESLGLSILVAIVIAWLVARWITAQAIGPLIAVTAELRRFAAGDFTPRSVATSDRSELGALIAAYNGATAQVAAAFAQRTRVDEQMRRFVADAGHELRTPLTVVSGFLDVLEKGGVDDPGIRERAFRTLRVETHRMRRLVERLMVLARLDRAEAPVPEIVDVAEIADGAVAEIEAARRGEIALSVLSRKTQVLGDRGDLHEAIGNLVDNALKYGAGSPVTVEVRRDADDVVVRVRDLGPGIPENERPHVFERFFRGGRTASVEGSGLGLAIAERAAARCAGTVRLESTGPHGTTFALVLPAHGARAAEPEPVRFA